MCAVSNIGDYWKRRTQDEYPWVYPYTQPVIPSKPFGPSIIQQGVSQEEFDKLKREVEELKQLIKAAQKFDDATNQPDCEVDSKIELIRKIAELVGVNMDDVFERKTNDKAV